MYTVRVEEFIFKCCKHFGVENDDLKYVKADHPLCLGLWRSKSIIMLLTV